MATHITHIVLTDKIYEEHFKDCNKKDFILGTLLPDIGNIDNNINRNTTHSYDISLDAIKSLTTCFDKWNKFHSLLDRVRDEFYISKWIYIPGGDEDFIMALKLLEDQYLYDKITDRDEYTKMLNDIPYQDAAFVKEHTLKQWYTKLQKLISSKPDDTTRKEFQQGIWIPEDRSNRVNIIINALQKDKEALRIIDELYESFWLLIKK